MLFYVLWWILIGFFSSALITCYDNSRGRDINISDLAFIALFSLFGPFSMCLFLVLLVQEWYKENKNKVIVKGKGRNK